MSLDARAYVVCPTAVVTERIVIIAEYSLTFDRDVKIHLTNVTQFLITINKKERQRGIYMFLEFMSKVNFVFTIFEFRDEISTKGSFFVLVTMQEETHGYRKREQLVALRKGETVVQKFSHPLSQQYLLLYVSYSLDILDISHVPKAGIAEHRHFARKFYADIKFRYMNEKIRGQYLLNAQGNLQHQIPFIDKGFEGLRFVHFYEKM
jgi:hypothetical protein